MNSLRWSDSPRPDTGITNGALGLWLFLAAEVMFFGSLLSSYVLLRLGNGALWAAEGLAPGVLAGSWKAGLLLVSSVTLAVAVRRVTANRPAGVLLGSAILLGAAFLGSRVSELVGLAAGGLLPKSGVATAMFYTVSGVHALHLFVVVVLLALLMIGSDASGPAPHRLRLIARAWHFFVSVWLVFFVLFHLS